MATLRAKSISTKVTEEEYANFEALACELTISEWAQNFSRNGRAAVEGFRRQCRNLAYAAGALRPSTGSHRPHQAQAAGIDRGFIIVGRAHGHKSGGCGCNGKTTELCDRRNDDASGSAAKKVGI